MSNDKSEKSEPNLSASDAFEDKKTIEDVASSIPQLMSLIKDLPYGTVLNREDGLFFNKVVEDIIGYSNDEIKTIDDWVKYLHPDNSNEMRKVYEYDKDVNPEIGIIIDLVTKNGVKKKIRSKNKLTELGYIWGIVDETELLELRAENKFINEEYEFILNSIKMGVWDWDIKADKLIWNDTMSEILGYHYTFNVSGSESILNLLHPDDAVKMKDDLKQVINTPGKEFESIFRIILNDGTLKHIRSVSKTYRNQDGIAIRMVGLNSDVTKELELVEEKKELSERYDFIFDSIKMGAWDWDIKTNNLIWNDIMYEIFGYEVGTKISSYDYILNIMHPDDAERVNNEMTNSVITPGVEFESTFRVVLNDGITKHIRSVSKTYRNQDGIATRMVGLNWDVTERIELEEKKKELEEDRTKINEEYEFLLDSINVGFWHWSFDTNLIVWNDRMYEIYGKDVNTKIKGFDDYKEILHPDDLERINKEISLLINKPGEEFSSTFRIIMRDGFIKHIRAAGRAYRDEFGIATKMVGLNWDITKEIEDEEKWKELAQKYELILNSTGIGVWEWDIKHNEFTRSDTIYDLYEMTKITDASFEYAFEEYEKKIHSEDLFFVQSNMERLISGEIDSSEGEFRIITSSGNIKHTKYTTKIEKENDGTVTRIYGINLDISKIKQYELQLIEAVEKADSSNKAKSEFLANMSHEIRTPMNAIIGLSHLLLGTNLSEKQTDYLKKIKNSSNSLLRIINDILDFSKIESGKIDIEEIEFPLSQVLDTVSSIISHNAQEKGLEIIFSVEQDVPLILIGDPLRLGQIIINICSNAVKFTMKGEIIIRIERVYSDSEQLELKVTITDTGIGIKEEYIPNLFNSFSQSDSSTTRKYGGSGLGLSISKNLVELLGGRVWVESEFGKGSKFFFTFKSEKNKTAITRDYIPNVEMRGLRVLVCDDNESSRNVLEEVLTSFTFLVTTVENGYEAIEEINNSGDNPFDLVLMDFEMPGLNGLETTRKIHNLKLKKLPIVIMVTAYAKEKVLEEASEMKLDAFLIKPVTSSLLFDTIINLFQNEKRDYKFNTRNRSRKVVNFDVFKGKRILLAEDNEINQIVAEELLTNVGLIVDIANNGEEAVQKAKLNRYDLVLMDLHMPIKDGYEATIEIRKFRSPTELPIIAKTADAMENVKERCLQIGMNDFLTKPIDPDKLFSVLFKWLSPDSYPKINLVIKPTSKLDIKKGVEGIDLEFGLKVVGGNEKLYNKLLIKFNQMYQNFYAGFSSACINDLELARREIHTLKGVAGNIGAMELYNLADKYVGLLNKDFYPNQDNMDDLRLELEKVLNSTSAFVTNVSDHSTKINNSELFLDKMNELEELLISNDYNSIKVINEIRELSDHLKYEKEFKLIKKLIADFEFEKGLIELKKLKVD